MDHATAAPTLTRSQARNRRRRRSEARRKAEARSARSLETSGPAPEALAGSPPLVRLLACRRAAVVAVEDLAREVGRDVEDLWDEVLELDRQGDVAAWPDHPRGPVVALSSRSAAALGLRLGPDGSRWIEASDRAAKPRGRRRKARETAIEASPVAATPPAEAPPGFRSVVTIVVAAGA